MVACHGQPTNKLYYYVDDQYPMTVHWCIYMTVVRMCIVHMCLHIASYPDLPAYTQIFTRGHFLSHGKAGRSG